MAINFRHKQNENFYICNECVDQCVEIIEDSHEEKSLKVEKVKSKLTPSKIVEYLNDYVIGQWGGIDLTVDPYTQAANGKVRLVINAYFDAKPRRAASFVTASVK